MMLPFLCSCSPNRKSSWFFTNFITCCFNIFLGTTIILPYIDTVAGGPLKLNSTVR